MLAQGSAWASLISARPRQYRAIQTCRRCGMYWWAYAHLSRQQLRCSENISTPVRHSISITHLVTWAGLAAITERSISLVGCHTTSKRKAAMSRLIVHAALVCAVITLSACAESLHQAQRDTELLGIPAGLEKE